jgi:hypothetical protein
MALGDALQENKVLRTLNVANNSIDSVACLTICAGVLENEVRHLSAWLLTQRC